MSNSFITEIVHCFKPPADGPMLFIGVGNTFRGDDGVGPYIASQLSREPGLTVIDAGINPENIVDQVVPLRPARILIFDAAYFGGQPGEVRLIPETDIPQTTLSTHAIPLNVVTGIIRDSLRTEIFFIGIQAASTELGNENLTAQVKQAADEIINQIKLFHPLSGKGASHA